MKIDKEYPATHSMDTAWFVTDLDGNVAIFQFEEDGPGPIPFTDLHTDELIPMLGETKDGISVMPRAACLSNLDCKYMPYLSQNVGHPSII